MFVFFVLKKLLTQFKSFDKLVLMSNLGDDLKNALSSITSGVGDVVTTVRNVTKKNVVETLQAGGAIADTSVTQIAGVVSEGITAASETGVSITGAASGLVMGAVEGTKEVGGDVGQTVVEAARGAIEGVSKVGGDVGETAVAVVDGAVKAAGEIGADSGELAKNAVVGTLKAADAIGSDAGSLIRKALLNAAALPHDIIDALLTGKTE